MSRTKNAARSIIWGVLEKLITIGSPFVIRTIIVYTLGDLFLGLNGLFTSLLQVLNVAELGVSSAIVYNMYKPLAKNDIRQVNALLNFYKKCYRIIGVIVLTMGILVLPFLRYLISGEIPITVNIYLLYILNLVNIVISYELCAYRISLLIANQRNDIVSKIRLLVLMIQTVVQVLILIYLKNYYLFILTLIFSTILNNLATAYFSKVKYPQFKCEGTISKTVLRDIKVKVSGMLFQKVGGIVLASVDTLVISSFLGLRILALYQNYYYILTAVFGILSIIMQSLIAPVGNSIALETKEKNYINFKTFNFIYVWIVSFCTISLLCIYQPFMRLWVGEETMFSFYMVILFVIYFFTHKWCDMLYVYQDASGIWWETRLVPFVAAIVNLFINVVLVNIIGLPGILISTIISVIFIYDLGYAYILFKVYFNSLSDLKKFISRQFSYLITTVLGGFITFYICNIVNLSSVYSLMYNCLICIVVPNVIFYFIWRRSNEFSESINLILRLIPTDIKNK